MEKNFDLFISQLAETNATLDFYTDFSKIRENVRSIEIKMNTLNYLIGKMNPARFLLCSDYRRRFRLHLGKANKFVFLSVCS